MHAMLARTQRTTAGMSPGSARVRRRRALLVGSTLVVTSVLAAAPYLALYTARASVSPVGSDTPTYIWRTRLVSAFGVDALSDASPFPFHGNTSNVDRPGFPVLGSLLRLGGVSPWHFAFIVPALAAVAAALAAGAFAILALGEPDWAFPLYALALAWSPQIAVTANGYLDNILVDGIVVAAVAMALAAARGEPGVVAAILLIVAAVSIHWVFAAFVLVVLAAATVVALPGSIRASKGTPIGRTPSGRLAAVVAGSAFGGVATVFLAPGLPAAFAPKTYAGYLSNLTRQVRYYQLGATLPLATVGGASLALGRGAEVGARRRALMVSLLWLLPVGAGWVAFEAGYSIPFQRLLGFSLPVPLLAAAAFVWLVGFASRRWGRIGAGVAATIAVVALVATGANTWRALDRTQPILDAHTLGRTQAVMRYLEGVSADRPVVFVVDGASATNDFTAIPAFRRIRASAPAALIARISVYVGDPRMLLQGRATTRPNAPAFDRVSALYWSHLEGIAARDPVVVAMAPYYPKVAALMREGAVTPLAPGAVVLRGPAPAAPVSVTAPDRVPAGIVVRDATVALVALLLVGLGWSTSLVRPGALARVALAPAFGVAVLVTAGLAWSRAGLSLGGASGMAVAAGAALLGWAPRIVREAKARKLKGPS